MAHKDKSGYYMKVTLVENGNHTPRRIQRIEWQDQRGQVHFLEGRNLPSDLTILTGKGQEEKHFAKFLGVEVPQDPAWDAYLPTKANLTYVIVGVALVFILDGILTLAMTNY